MSESPFAPVSSPVVCYLRLLTVQPRLLVHMSRMRIKIVDLRTFPHCRTWRLPAASFGEIATTQPGREDGFVRRDGGREARAAESGGVQGGENEPEPGSGDGRQEEGAGVHEDERRLPPPLLLEGQAEWRGRGRKALLPTSFNPFPVLLTFLSIY